MCEEETMASCCVKGLHVHLLVLFWYLWASSTRSGLPGSTLSVSEVVVITDCGVSSSVHLDLIL